MLRAATTGSMELTKDQLEEMVESMEHAEAHMQDQDQDFYEKKLEEQKKEDEVKDAEKAEKLALENKRAPHFCNLNTDPQISQTIYYGLKELPVRIDAVYTSGVMNHPTIFKNSIASRSWPDGWPPAFKCIVRSTAFARLQCVAVSSLAAT